VEKYFSKKSLKKDLFPTLFLNAQDQEQEYDKAKRQSACKRTVEKPIKKKLVFKAKES